MTEWTVGKYNNASSQALSMVVKVLECEQSFFVSNGWIDLAHYVTLAEVCWSHSG